MAVWPWCGHNFLYGALKAACGREESAAFPTCVQLRTWFRCSLCSFLSLSKSARLLFHSEAHRRVGPSKLSTQLPQSRSFLSPFWSWRAQTIRSARVSKLSWVFCGGIYPFWGPCWISGRGLCMAGRLSVRTDWIWPCWVNG